MCKSLVGQKDSDIPGYNVQLGEFPDHPGEFDVYILTGSPSGVYDGDPWISELETFIQEVYSSRTKMIGICFGHQIMAQALGGQVIKSDKGYGLGIMDYDIVGHDSSLSLPAWHQDQVISAPDNAEVFLTSAFCPIAGLKYDDHAISLQPHPEFSKDFVEDLIKFRTGDTITLEQAELAARSLSKKTTLATVQKILHDFLSL